MPLFSRDPILIAPKFGILDISLGLAESNVAEDRFALEPLFATTVIGSALPISCDVLFVYCGLESNGSISRSPLTLPEIVREVGCTIAVVATANTSKNYIAASEGKAKTHYGKVNLVMTLDRRGDSFPKFFRQLFGDMLRGTPMLKAWVTLAPQDAMMHAEAPDTIFVNQAGNVKFK